MNFERMPWDTQNCRFAMGAYSKNGAEVEYRWKEGRPAMDKLTDMENSEWVIGDPTSQNYRADFGIGLWWAEIHADFTMTRIPDTYEKLNFRVVLLVIMAYCGCWVAPAQALTLAVIAVLVVSGTLAQVSDDVIISPSPRLVSSRGRMLAQVDARLPPLSYNVWLVDFQARDDVITSPHLAFCQC